MPRIQSGAFAILGLSGSAASAFHFKEQAVIPLAEDIGYFRELLVVRAIQQCVIAQYPQAVLQFGGHAAPCRFPIAKYSLIGNILRLRNSLPIRCTILV